MPKPEKKSARAGKLEREGFSMRHKLSAKVPVTASQNLDPVSPPPTSVTEYNLGTELAKFGLPIAARNLDSQFTLSTTRGFFSIYFPRECIGVCGDKLRLGHPCERGIFFRREEILGCFPGVWAESRGGHHLFQPEPQHE